MVIVRPETPDPNEVVSDETLRFNYPGSDIILRSCDSHNFRMPKLNIVICSPVLRMLIRSVPISLPNTSVVPNIEETEPLPIVELPESKATIYNLLTFIFPVAPILPSTAEKIMELLAAAQKYQMDSVLSQIRLAITRQDPPFIRPETALDVYFLAQEHELLQEATQAARITLRASMTIEGLGDKLEFPGMTGAYLHELWKYHVQVRTDLQLGIPEFKNSGLSDDVKGLRCHHPSNPYASTFPRWLDDYIASVAASPHLFDLVEFEYAHASHIKSQIYYHATCPCADISSQVIRAFWKALAAFVSGSMEKVRRNGGTRPCRH